MEQCGMKLVLVIFFILDIAVIVATVGIFGWKVDRYKDTIKNCKDSKNLFGFLNENCDEV